jgi:hypothetical protein
MIIWSLNLAPYLGRGQGGNLRHLGGQFQLRAVMGKTSRPKKISPYDVIQALRRKPTYRADYLDFFFWCRENGVDEADYSNHPGAAKRAEVLCKKYGITYLFNPSVNIPLQWVDGAYIEEKDIVEVIYPTEYRYLTEDELNEGIMPRYLQVPIFKDRDELIIKIDLKADKEVIVNKFIEKLNYYHYFIIRNNSRMTSDSKVDKWEVFDAYNQTKSFEKVEQKLNTRAANYIRFIKNFGINPEGPQKLNVSTVRKAYYRAFELVYGEKYDSEKHNPNNLPVELRGTCDKCPEQSTCKALCAQAMEYVEQGSKGSLRGLVAGEGISNIPDPRTDPEGICPKPAPPQGLKGSAVADKNLGGTAITCEECGTVYFPESKKNRECPFCN